MAENEPMTLNQIRQSLLEQVGKWFDSATKPDSQDHSLTISRSNFLRNQERKIVASSFTVRAEMNVGGFVAPVEESNIIIPTSPPVVNR